MSKNVLDIERPIMELEEKIAEMRSISDQLDIESEIEVLEQIVERLRTRIFDQLTRWQRLQRAPRQLAPIVLDRLCGEIPWQDRGTTMARAIDAFRDERGHLHDSAEMAIVADIAAAGWEISGVLSFRDHHRFDARDLARIEAEARAKGSAVVLTTEKDAVRLAACQLGDLPIASVPLEVGVEPRDWLLERIRA